MMLKLTSYFMVKSIEHSEPSTKIDSLVLSVYMFIVYYRKSYALCPNSMVILSNKLISDLCNQHDLNVKVIRLVYFIIYGAMLGLTKSLTSA